MASRNQKISKVVKDALEFFKFDKVPTMKVLKTKYREEAIKVHPDKNNGSSESKEAFQTLQYHCQVLVDYIMKNDVPNDVFCDDERESREFFRTFNWEVKNMFTYTHHVETDMAKFWKTVLVGEFGPPAVNNAKEGNPGLKFTSNKNSKKIFITLWENPANGAPKILIQSGSTALRDEFVANELPKLYKKVRDLAPQVVGDSGGDAAKPEDLKARHRNSKFKTFKRGGVKRVTKIKNKCSFCSYMARNQMAMDKHFKASHKGPENRFDSKRDLNETANEAGVNADGVDETVTEEEYDGIPVDDEEEVELNNEWINKIKDLEKKVKEKESLLAEKEKVIEKLNKDKKDLEKTVQNVKDEMVSRTKELTEKHNENVKLKAQCQFTEEVKIMNADLQKINTMLEQDLEKA